MQRREAKVEIGLRIENISPHLPFYIAGEERVHPQFNNHLWFSSAHSFPIRGYRCTSCNSGNCSYQSTVPYSWGKNAVLWFRLKYLWCNSLPLATLPATVVRVLVPLCYQRAKILCWSNMKRDCRLRYMIAFVVEFFFATLIWKVKNCKLNDLMHFRLHEQIMKSGKKWTGESEHNELRIRFLKRFLGT